MGADAMQARLERRPADVQHRAMHYNSRRGLSRRIRAPMADPYVVFALGAFFSGLILLRAVSAHSAGITALAVDPVTPETVYAGTFGGGVFKSTNSGENWSASGLTNKYVWALAIARTAPSTTVYAATNDGVYRSGDGGVTWIASATGATVSIAALAIDPTNPTTLPGSCWHGILTSTSGRGTGRTQDCSVATNP